MSVNNEFSLISFLFSGLFVFAIIFIVFAVIYCVVQAFGHKPYPLANCPGDDKDGELSKDQLLNMYNVDFDTKIVDDAKGACELLKVDMPEVRMKWFLVSNNMAQGFVNEGTDPRIFPWTEKPGAIYYDKHNVIVLAKLNSLTGEESTYLDHMGNILHEIRHVWQNKYHHDEYYSEENAIGPEQSFEDKSEIDADAFSIAYMLHKLNLFDGMKAMLDMSMQQMSGMDGGKRIKRIKEISKEYGWE